MAEVALAAGVSRQTLYNAFGSRQEVDQAYVMREAERFVDAVADAIRSRPEDPRGARRAALEIFLGAGVPAAGDDPRWPACRGCHRPPRRPDAGDLARPPQGRRAARRGLPDPA